MSTIVAFPSQPDRSDPDRPTPVTCASWCIDGIGHADAVHPAEQRCRSYVHRVDASIGGGSIGGGSDVDLSVTPFGGLFLQTEQTPGQQPVFTLGTELAGGGQWIRVTTAELRMARGYAETLLQQAA